MEWSYLVVLATQYFSLRRTFTLQMERDEIYTASLIHATSIQWKVKLPSLIPAWVIATVKISNRIWPNCKLQDIDSTWLTKNNILCCIVEAMFLRGMLMEQDVMGISSSIMEGTIAIINQANLVTTCEAMSQSTSLASARIDRSSMITNAGLILKLPAGR